MDAARITPGSVLLDELSATSAELTIAAARELLLEYGRFVIAQSGAARFCLGALEKEAARLPDSFLEQGGGCIFASVESQAAGFVAWRSLAPTSVVLPDSWEMKRLWVRPGARGLSLGRSLSQAVLDRAVAAHRRAVYLDTAPASMPAAHRLYLDLGFEPCAAYNDNQVEGLAYLVKYL